VRPIMLAVLCGAAIVLLDARVWSDPGVPTPFVIGCAFLLGVFYPSRPLRPAIALWSTIALLESLRVLAMFLHLPAPLASLGHRNPYPPSFPNLAVAIIPACAAAILGAWIVRALASTSEVAANE
jgi:hypothetical protein